MILRKALRFLSAAWMILATLPLAQADTVIIRFENDAISLNSSFVPAPELPNSTLQYQATHLDLNIYTLDPGINATLYCEQLLASEYEIDSCTEDTIVALDAATPTPTSAPVNDPDYPQQYGLTQTRVPELWALGTVGSPDVKICHIDTGADLTHPDLQKNLWTNPSPTFGDIHGASFLAGVKTGDPQDDNGHGSLVSGLMAATVNNSIGIAGILPAVSLIECKFMSSSGSGSMSDAVSCMDYCIGVGAHILQNSWGTTTQNPALQLAVQATQAAGVLVVASAGNDGVNDDTSRHLPSDGSKTQLNVISVAATDSTRALWSGSNYGTYGTQLAAPGVKIESTALGGDYKAETGTSFAAPHVSGVAALLYSYLLSRGLEINNSPTAAQAVAYAIVNSTMAFTSQADQAKVNGTLDAVNALAVLKDYLSSPGRITPGSPAIGGFSGIVIGIFIGLAIAAVAFGVYYIVKRRRDKHSQIPRTQEEPEYDEEAPEEIPNPIQQISPPVPPVQQSRYPQEPPSTQYYSQQPHYSSPAPQNYSQPAQYSLPRYPGEQTQIITGVPQYAKKEDQF